ncbi:hypothetical protein HYQ46_000571 [Verticillium longisporum]|nr:hypothetical protein HYQ46_000571 [Verticillium longisporum]
MQPLPPGGRDSLLYPLASCSAVHALHISPPLSSSSAQSWWLVRYEAPSDANRNQPARVERHVTGVGVLPRGWVLIRVPKTGQHGVRRVAEEYDWRFAWPSDPCYPGFANGLRGGGKSKRKVHGPGTIR